MVQPLTAFLNLFRNENKNTVVAHFTSVLELQDDQDDLYQNIPLEFKVPSNFPPLAYNLANNPPTEKGFELGKKGTTSSNLVQENYANFCLSLSFNDRWFEKRKFN